MATPSKTQLVSNVYTQLRKRYKPDPHPEKLPILEAVIYGVCHEGTTREQANQALSRFKDEFFDWNEMRVSTVDEIQSCLAGLPDPGPRAERIRRFLRQLFAKTYGFALDAVTKKPLKEAVKMLQQYEVFRSDYVLATVIQHALSGHAIPIDAPTRRALERLGIADPKQDSTTLRSLLERAIPKNRGSEFVDLLEELTQDVCLAENPKCAQCDLKKTCPTGIMRLSPKPRGAKGKPTEEKKTKPAPAESQKAPAKKSTPKPAPKAKTQPPAKKAAAPKRPKGRK